ncbi:hypothetical protein [Methylobacterium soli]|uniref:Uncharacterized protein n=1 Tax=Methylobacterium soli TaxID=553447 RepID=A0A6L3T2P2_9HYPH|nr:hypothetical protein [Methylobacterium soli]KAB1079406.1 hypothetical protein F6X53_11425 [Methylobacterium soli]GJE45379.1 hypothetical protein AEGHOMDF_4573 [Methylobacterium soli]
MRYVQPFDQPDNPDGSYQNGNVELGIQGSIADAKAWEFPQREIINVITEAGLTPTNNNLTQLAEAIPIIAFSGSNSIIVDTPITKTVHGFGGDFADLNAAFSWLSRRSILPTGSVTFQIAIGTGISHFVYTDNVVFSHKDGSRVFIKGAPLNAPIPNPNLLTSTGNGAPARASDTAANLNALRNSYSSELFFANGTSFTVIGNLGNLQDVLLTSDQTGTGVNILRLLNGSQTLTRVSCVNAQNCGLLSLFSDTALYGTCHFLGSGLHGVVVGNNGTMTLKAGAALSCQSNALDGLSVTGGGVVTADGDFSTAGPPVYARANGQYGVEGNAAIVVLAASGAAINNGQAGYFASNPGLIRADGCVSSGSPYGFQALYFAQISAVNTSGASTTFAYVANNSSQIIRIGGTATAPTVASPAVGASGNNGSIII